MKKICQAADLQEAAHIQGYLDGYKIETTLQGESLNSVAGELPYHQAFPTIHIIKDEEFGRACELMKDYFNREKREVQNAAIHSWNCPQCGEEHVGQFTQCWNCQTERPELEEKLES